MRVTAELNLKYLDGFFDKKKNRQRWRVRRKGFPYIELPPNGDPSSPEFLAAYYAALRGEQPNDAAAAVAACGGSGSVKDAVEKYLNSTTFKDYEVSTQGLRRPILKAFLEPEIARLPLAQMDREYLEGWLETAPTMGVKRTWLLTVRPFFQWASSPALKLMANDPTEGIKVKVRESKGHHSWIDEEVEQYRSHFSLGTMGSSRARTPDLPRATPRRCHQSRQAAHEGRSPDLHPRKEPPPSSDGHQRENARGTRGRNSGLSQLA
jgi:hypothetical protein